MAEDDVGEEGGTGGTGSGNTSGNDQLMALLTQLLQQQQQGGAPQAPFGLDPASASKAAGLTHYNYASKAGYEIFKSAVRQLTEEKLKLNAEDFTQLQTALTGRSESCGWTCTKVPKDLNDTTKDLEDVIEGYGNFTLDHLTSWVKTYFGTVTMMAQEDIQMGQAIMNTMSASAAIDLQPHQKQFRVMTHTGEKRISGVLLYKVIIRESVLDTDANQSLIEERILAMPEQFMNKYNGNVKEFTKALRAHVTSLKARGKTTENALHVAWKAFSIKPTPSDDFRRWAVDLKRKVNGGEVKVTLEQFLAQADVYYNELVDAGEWGATAGKQEDIQALEVKVAGLQKQQTKFGKTLKKRNQSQGGGDAPNEKKVRFTKGASEDELSTPPKSGEPQTKKMKNFKGKMVDFKWCSKCRSGKGRWTTTHSTSEHRGRSGKDKEGAKYKSSKLPPKEAVTKMKAQLAMAVEAVAKGDDEFDMDCS